MSKSKLLRGSFLVVAVASVGTLSGCGHYEVNTGRGAIPGHYIRYEMQEADRSLEAARAAGKDKMCPAEFQQAEDAKIKAYDWYRLCHTEEGAAMAKQATAKANALCPPVAAKPEPVPVVVAPVPPPAAPTDRITVTPGSIVKGEGATLNWSSQNASACEIQPGIGPVQLQGSMAITPGDDTAYTLLCNGAGGSAKSEARIVVAAPVVAPVVVAPVVEAVQPAPVVNLCKPALIDIRFDTNKWNIKPQYAAELKKLADFLKEFPKATGTIGGHTDSDGNLAANMKLSQHRADSVRSYLVDKFGIAGDRIKAVGYGPTRPLDTNKTKAGKQKNRRIESNFSCN